jgi:tRNA (cytidine32/guanosine34-2'-O)-methyltransferase
MVLRPGGSFVSKVFRTKSLPTVYSQLGQFFESLMLCKPRASRLSSVEAFVVCKGFSNPEGFVPTLLTDRLPTGEVPNVPFLSCGDPYGLDAERTYPLSDDGD